VNAYNISNQWFTNEYNHVPMPESGVEYTMAQKKSKTEGRGFLEKIDLRHDVI